jgi:hypothetical protein
LLEADPLDVGLLVVLSLAFGELESGFELEFELAGFEAPAALPVTSDPELLLDVLPRPLTVTRSRTRRFPAKELAIRFAVSFSLPVGTLPVSSIAISLTLTLMVSPCSVGSFCSAV